MSNEGITKTERYLKRLCNKSFLSLWSRAGIYNDKKPGQEICDVLVVFDNDIIIFSDKHCEFPDTDDDSVNWQRWYRKAIKKSADQLYGAERWIRKFPERIYLDQSASIKFPFDFPPMSKMRIHRIAVAHPIAEACRKHFGGGSGSLHINSKCEGDSIPFTIGQVDSTKGFVHVFDDNSLDIMLTTLDTVPDFVDYLSKKEIAFSRPRMISAPGEEELLGYYFKNADENGKHDFIFPNGDAHESIFLDDSFWLNFSLHSNRLAQIRANGISYAWDRLIERFATHFSRGTLYEKNVGSLNEQEKLLRVLARENRTMRRMLSETIVDFLQKVGTGVRATRVLRPVDGSTETYYVFLALPQTSEKSYSEYRNFRMTILQDYCAVVKADHEDARFIVGYATESGLPLESSEDLIYLDTTNWTQKNRDGARELKARLIEAGLLGPQFQFEKTVEEFPMPSGSITRQSEEPKGKFRNKLCPCGSNRKYKKCHGSSYR